MHVRTEGAESFCARSTCFMIFFSYHYHTDGEGYNDTEWKMVEYKQSVRDKNSMVERGYNLTITANW